MMRCLMIRSGEEEYMCDINDIVRVSSNLDIVRDIPLIKDNEPKLIVGNDIFYVINEKKKERFKIIVAKIYYEKESHFRIKKYHIPVGIAVDEIINIVECEIKNEEEKIVWFNNKIYLLMDFNEYVKKEDIERIIERMEAYKKKLEEKKKSRITGLDIISKKRKIIELWKKKHQ